MGPDRTRDVTQILVDEQLSADERARRLLPLVYEQLRETARARMAGERRGHTLSATVLVHEVWLRLIGDRQIPWQNRAHFYVAAAEAMRRVLLDHAKARGRSKRADGRRRVPLSVVDLATCDDPSEIMDLDRAVCRLIECDPAIGDVVRLRFFTGLSIEDTAEALGISPTSVKRRWELARTWLFRELSDGDED